MIAITAIVLDIAGDRIFKSQIVEEDRSFWNRLIFLCYPALFVVLFHIPGFLPGLSAYTGLKVECI